VVVRRDRAFGFLLIVGALIPLAVVASGQTKVYDNDRLLMPAFPFLAALAGLGFSWFMKSLSSVLQRFGGRRVVVSVVSIVVACLLFIPPILSMASEYPYWLSYYSEGAGGLRGADRLGFETTYWSESYLDAVRYINDHAQPGDSVWVLPSSMDVLVYYQIHGILRKDVVLASLNPIETIYGPAAIIAQTPKDYSQATFVIVQFRQSFLYDSSNQPTAILTWLLSRQPAFRVERQGVPILDVYRNP
jgi:hypothetical protein